MKKKNIILIIIIIIVVILLGVFLFVISNKKNNNDSNLKYKKVVSLNESFTLPMHKKVIIKDEKLKIKLISSADGRCPKGAQCIWQGEIEYTLKVNNDTVKLGTVRTEKVDYKNYSIELDGNNYYTNYVNLKVKKN